MNKTELVAAIAEKTGLTKKDLLEQERILRQVKLLIFLLLRRLSSRLVRL